MPFVSDPINTYGTMAKSQSYLRKEKLTDSQSKLERLIELGYSREDIQVLPDGTLTIVSADEMRSSAIAIERATAPARLERMLARKRKLDEEFKLNTSTPLQMPSKKLQDYLELIRDIDRARLLLQEGTS